MNVSLSVTPAITSGHIALIGTAVSTSVSAVNVANGAASTANTAIISAGNAFSLAQSAGTSAINADVKAVSAISLSQAAVLTATNAATLANTAQLTANSAYVTSNAAQLTATNAVALANTAQLTANNAIILANSAQLTATNAITSASNIIASLSAKADLVGGKVPLAQLPTLGTGNVLSVNGLTGNVTLTKNDVGLSAVPNIDATNPINIIQTSAYRFVTDAEKTTWNAGGGSIPIDIPRTQSFNWTGALTANEKLSAAELSATFAHSIQILHFNTTKDVVFSIEEHLVSNDSLVKVHYLSSIISGAATDAAPFTFYTVTSPASSSIVRLYALNTTTSAASVTATGITLNINA